MNLLLIMMSLLSAIALAAAAVSVFALDRARRILIDACRKIDAGRKRPAAALEPDPNVQQLRETLAALEARVRDLDKGQAIVLEPGTPKPGLNLTRRSQALRMHRRGENVEQIASTLEIPRQEVDLLLKVHRIVLNTVGS